MTKGDYDKIVLAGDIGATNINFGIAGLKKSVPKILLQSRESTKSVNDFGGLVNKFLGYAKDQHYNPTEACLAVAGPVENKKGYQIVKMTNAELVIDTRVFKKETGLNKILITNDFDAISYAINVLKRNDFEILNRGKPAPNATRVVLGTGTGLGKNILYYNDKVNAYLPIPSEGGHADLPLLTKEDLKMAEFIKRIQGIETQLCYEDVLSGRGLENIYKYLSTTKYPKLPIDLSAAEISATKSDNPCSRETFAWFIRFYARCARNFALDTLARGGVYLAGGIAAKNPEVFSDFFEEFVKNEIYEHILRDMPVYLITNYDISLIGAAYALTLQ